MTIDSGQAHAERLHGAERIALWSVVGAFCAFGAMWGICHVVLVDLQEALKLSTGALGAAMTFGVSASIPSMLISGRLVDKLGPRALIAMTTLLLATGLLCFALARNYVTFCAAMAILYGSSGAYDVAINAAAIHIERITQRRVIAYFHGAFSGVAAISGLFAGYLLSSAVPFRWIYIGLAALMLAMSILIASNPVLVHAKVSSPKAAGRNVSAIKLLLVPTVLLVAAITTLSFLSENALQTWSSIYLRISLGVPVLIGSIGPAGVYASMSLGRFISGYVVTHLGRCALLRISGVLTALGMIIALSSTTPWIVIAGFLFCGLAQSGIAPVAYSIGGDVAPDKAGQVTSIITTISYTGFLSGPALIGGLAELYGLRLALGLVIVGGVLISILALYIKEPKPVLERLPSYALES